MSELSWSKDLPCEEGWYWKWDKYMDHPQVVHVAEMGGTLYQGCFQLDRLYSHEHEDTCLWAGPIVEPRDNREMNDD